MNPQESSSPQRTIDWKGPNDEHSVALYKHSNRPDHDCIQYFNPRRVRKRKSVLHQSGSDAIILYDNMPASALDKVVTFAGEVLFERNPPTSIKPAATPGERIDLRTTGQPEVPHAQHEKSGKTYLISSLTKQVLNSPNKSTIIAKFIRNYAQEKTQQVEYCPVSHQDSEIHTGQNGKTERHEVSKIEDSVQCQKCSRYRDQANMFAAVVVCYRALPKRSRSKQSNESAVDSSCTSVAFMI